MYMCNDMQYGIYGHLHFPGTITSSFAVIRSAGFKLSLMYDKNTYWILRHGRSKANEAGIIVSSIDNGVKQEYGLAESGFVQAAAAGQLLQQQLSQAGVLPSVIVYSSPFSRTLETARTAAAAAGLEHSSCMHVTPLLAERYFGSALELTSHDNYCPFWDSDAQDPTSRPTGSEDGESVVQVSQRVHQLFQGLEQKHQGQHILLVSHGDTLSILQATYHGSPLGQHRQYGLATAELKCLNPNTEPEVEAGPSSRQLASATASAAGAVL